MKPFWAFEHILFTTRLSLLFVPLLIILCKLDNKLMGLQFFKNSEFLFLGLSLIQAELKLGVSLLCS